MRPGPEACVSVPSLPCSLSQSQAGKRRGHWSQAAGTSCPGAGALPLPSPPPSSFPPPSLATSLTPFLPWCPHLGSDMLVLMSPKDPWRMDVWS